MTHVDGSVAAPPKVTLVGDVGPWWRAARSGILVNAMLVVILAVTSGSFFWPIFPMLGWGIGLGLHAWEADMRQEPTEDRIQREMDRLRQDRARRRARRSMRWRGTFRVARRDQRPRAAPR